MDKDFRKSMRLWTTIPTIMSIVGAPFFKGRISNIGLHGVLANFSKSENPLVVTIQQGYLANFSFHLDEKGDDSLIPGKVVWAENNNDCVRVGIKFLETNLQNKNRVRAFISSVFKMNVKNLPRLIGGIVRETLPSRDFKITHGFMLKTFDELGIDSFTALEILVAIEKQFGIQIKESDAVKFRNLFDVIRYLENLFKFYVK